MQTLKLLKLGAFSLFFLSLACSSAQGALPCSSFEKTATYVLPATLNEISGIALSHTNPKFIWTHVDSDGPASLYLVNRLGALLRIYDLNGATNVDWEDIAVGPCSSASTKSCIYIADLGDNNFSRQDKKIYIVEEPDLSDGISDIGKTSSLNVLDVQDVVYPQSADYDKSQTNPDSESILVHPVTGDIYIISKHSNGGVQTLYAVPRVPGKLSTMVRLASYSFNSGLGSAVPLYNAVTAADFAPYGDVFAVRTYASTFEFDLWLWQDMATAFVHPVERFGSAELQGEGLTYDSDGISIITSGELVSRLSQPPSLNHFGCIIDGDDAGSDDSPGAQHNNSHQDLANSSTDSSTDVQILSKGCNAQGGSAGWLMFLLSCCLLWARRWRGKSNS